MSQTASPVLHARPRGGVSHELTIGRAVEVRPPLWVSRRPRSTPHPSAHSPTHYVMWGTLGVTDVHGMVVGVMGGRWCTYRRRKGASRGREWRRGPVGPRTPASSSSAAGTRGRYYRVRQPPPPPFHTPRALPNLTSSALAQATISPLVASAYHSLYHRRADHQRRVAALRPRAVPLAASVHVTGPARPHFAALCLIILHRSLACVAGGSAPLGVRGEVHLIPAAPLSRLCLSPLRWPFPPPGRE